ncbi:MAG: hypothetical protein HY435_00910 [Candidatus Liptonbacteria bacterium]|nr:hypothetical protein [Candidatus Liptonbacteria bacterium]
MIIALYGPDDFRRRQKEKFYIAEFAKKHSGIGVGRFDFSEEGALEKFQNFVKNRSIFEPYKLTVLGSLFEAPEAVLREMAKELKALADVKEITILISEEKTALKELNTVLKKAFSTEKFEYLEGEEWEKFVKSEVKNLSIALSDSAVKFLAQAYQGDTWRLVTEIQKISFLDKKTIEKSDLEKLDIEITPNFWNLLHGLKSRDLKERLISLDGVLDQNEPAAKVFNILAYQWPEKLGDFADYDVAVKSGKMDYEEALVDLII